VSRPFAALAIALALVASTLAPSAAAEAPAPEAETQRALALLNTPCLVAQVPGTVPPPAATPSPLPSPGPTEIPAPRVQIGPGVLVPPPLPSASPVTPPPLPTPSSTPSGSPPPVIIAPLTPTPPPTPTPLLTSGPIPRASPTESAAAAVPSPAETLGPNDYAVLGDELTGNRNGPWDLVGNVTLLYQEGALIGERAHYDGERYIDVTGNPYLRNRAGDATFAADVIRFDTKTQRAYLVNGRGVTTEGVQTGRLHFNARNMVTDRDGHTHGERASLTTCENPHGGYHIEAKTLDVMPGDRAVARAAVLFLGPLAVLYLPVLVIPLRHVNDPLRHSTAFVPVVGYSQSEGYYIKARVGFAPSNTYYGYYRIEGYTKIGFGLGYVATISRRDGRRIVNIDYFGQHNKTTDTNNHNLNLSDQETFSPNMRGTLRFSYTGNYGPLLNLPPSISVAAGLNRISGKSSENYSYAHESTGAQTINNNYGFSDTYTFSPKLTNAAAVTLTTNDTDTSTFVSSNRSLHFNTITHLTGNTVDYDLTLDKYDATTPTGVNKLPEFMVRPHGNLFKGFKGFPTTGIFTLGEYSDPVADLATGRAEAQLNFGPALLHTLVGDFNGTINIRQDAYGTGDMKANIQQQYNLTTPLGGHVSNTLSYSNQHINGLGNEPFSFDSIGGASKTLQEVIRFFNGDVYALTLQTGTAFNMQAQPISYQLISRPFRGWTFIAGGAWTPGPGNGFDRTNVQVAVPFGRTTDFQMSTFVDWKNKGRLESKQIYIRKIIGDCYEVRVAYNQDLKTVNVSVDLLAFPSQALNFGIGQQTSIIPQSFATDQFFNGAR
jgi:hypothetical protein